MIVNKENVILSCKNFKANCGLAYLNDHVGNMDMETNNMRFAVFQGDWDVVNKYLNALILNNVKVMLDNGKHDDVAGWMNDVMYYYFI